MGSIQELESPVAARCRPTPIRPIPDAPGGAPLHLAAPKTLSGVRVEGLDLARGLAILGMVLVNYSIDANEEHAGAWLISFIDALQGRAAAAFVVLAGIGISLLSRRARLFERPDLLREARTTLLKRAGFLFVTGMALLPLWPADILHFYAVYLLAAVLFLTVPDRVLWSGATAFVSTFVIMFFVFDYNEGWNTDSEYVYIWSSTFRRIWFDGYYPLFPWMAFILIGMWFGRQDLRDRKRRRRILVPALLCGVSLQLVSSYAVSLASLDELDIAIGPLDLLGTSPFPPGPVYIATSAAFALVVVILSLEVASRFPRNLLVRMLVASGQLALTIYVLHATLGLLLLDSLLETTGDALNVAAGAAGVFCLISMIFAFLWRREQARGPLEYIMRRVTSTSANASS